MRYLRLQLNYCAVILMDHFVYTFLQQRNERCFGFTDYRIASNSCCLITMNCRRDDISMHGTLSSGYYSMLGYNFFSSIHSQLLIDAIHYFCIIKTIASEIFQKRAYCFRISIFYINK